MRSLTTPGSYSHAVFYPRLWMATAKHREGIYYFNARWYDPELGRFITEDPVRDGVNWYVYCNNSPLVYTDPSGLGVVPKGTGGTPVIDPLNDLVKDANITSSSSSADEQKNNEIVTSTTNRINRAPSVSSNIRGQANNSQDLGLSRQARIQEKILRRVIAEFASANNQNQNPWYRANFFNDQDGQAVPIAPSQIASIEQTGDGYTITTTGGNTLRFDGNMQCVGGDQLGLVDASHEVIAVASLIRFGFSMLSAAGNGARTLPQQIHHFATNKNSVYTRQMESIANQFNLSLDGAWNRALMPHLGRHPNAYHQFVLRGMRSAAASAGGNQATFLQLFNQNVIQPVLQNPNLLRKAGW